MAPPADMVMSPAAAAAFGGASPFHDYAFCEVVAGPAPPPACCAAAAPSVAPLGAPSAGASSDGACSMDADDGGDAARALDALLAAAARKPGFCEGEVCDVTAAEAAPAQHPPAVFTTPALPPAALAVLGQYGATRAAAGEPAGISAAASALIAGWGLADTFYVYDLGEVARLHALWRAAVPRVAAFYAVKCNPEPGIVAMLDALGAGFDCASVQELERARALGVPQDRIIFANPCKRPADFRYAAQHGIEYTTFDCASELEKIAAGYPAFKCVLRIRCDDETCKINLGLKYGADPDDDVPALLARAKELGLQVVGVSFHVGSGCQNVAVYSEAIRRARDAFDTAASMGFDDMHLLDIGGGFTAPYDAASADLFYRTVAVINGALDESFPAGCGVRIIAEPGRYFAETSATLFTTILGQRTTRAPAAAAAAQDAAGVATAAAGAGAAAAGGEVFRDYWLSDGTYGSFRIQVAVDGLEPSYTVLRSPLLPPPGPELAAPAACRLLGDSGLDSDVVHARARLPALRDGDWLAFPYAGAYTICSASKFGGGRMTEPTKLFVCSTAAERDLGAYNAAAARAAGAAACEGAGAPAGAACSPPACAAAAAEMLQALSFGRRDGGGDDACGGDCGARSDDGMSQSAASDATLSLSVVMDDAGCGQDEPAAADAARARACDAAMAGCCEGPAPVRLGL